MALPADAHVHSEWSWDTGGPHSAAAGRMRATCERAMRIGLPALVFTEHLDFPGAMRSRPQDLMDHHRGFLDEDGLVQHPVFEPEGYFEAVAALREEFPELTILTGIEFGQPHLFEARARELVDLQRLDRINGSLHTLDMGSGVRAEPVTLYSEHPADDVMRAYLDELLIMIVGSEVFEALTHIDYAARKWPSAEAGPFDPRRFEGGFRAAMRALVESGRALEMNTSRLWPWVPLWWAEEGGRAVSFGSDAHTPDALARSFPEAAAMLDHVGFRPGPSPWDFWTR